MTLGRIYDDKIQSLIACYLSMRYNIVYSCSCITDITESDVFNNT